MAWSKEDIEKTFKIIIRKIADDGFSLRKALREESMPGKDLFYKWIDEDESKKEQYARATISRADNIFEDILDISDDQEGDVYIDNNGFEQTNHNVIARSKLRIDSRKWMLGKMQPKKYGDKIEVDQTNTNINYNAGELTVDEAKKLNSAIEGEY